MGKFGVYIHIPFCKQKCKYCDFISFSSEKEIIKRYIYALIKEIKMSSYKRKVSTIYIGGGTPSLLDIELINELISSVKETFEIEENAEITIEVNPGTVDIEKLAIYKKNGINRISIGLQSTNDRILSFIGRIHNYQQFIETYSLVKKIGYQNINVDLMFGIPIQTIDEIIKSVNEIIQLSPTHISLYSLILEKDTEMYKMVKSKKVQLLDDNIERDMYWQAKRILEKNKYKHYEISNFALENYESKHNIDCWNQEEYIGFGIAAHSYLNWKRFSNINNLEEYIKNIEENNIQKNIIVHEVQNINARIREYMILGLRKLDGVSINNFKEKFEIDPLIYFKEEINNLLKKGLIEIENNYIRLNQKGLDFANLVFEEFI